MNTKTFSKLLVLGALTLSFGIATAVSAAEPTIRQSTEQEANFEPGFTGDQYDGIRDNRLDRKRNPEWDSNRPYSNIGRDGGPNVRGFTPDYRDNRYDDRYYDERYRNERISDRDMRRYDDYAYEGDRKLDDRYRDRRDPREFHSGPTNSMFNEGPRPVGLNGQPKYYRAD